ETDRQRAARAVVHHDLLGELFAELGPENARDRIGRAAGSLRDDEPDRPVRVPRRRPGRNVADKQRQGESKHAPYALASCRRSWPKLQWSRPSAQGVTVLA